MNPTMAMKLVLFGVLLAIVNTVVTKNVSTAQEINPNPNPQPKKFHDRPRKPQREGLTWDFVVAQDGSGNFRTIKKALNKEAQRRERGRRFVIYVKSGTYKEDVVVKKHMKNITLLGDGIGNTIICGNQSHRERNMKTNKGATVEVLGDGFVAMDITFQNKANQAPAITVSSPHAAFYRCGFEGHQDTIFVKDGLQLYRECDIYGAVNVILGDAAVVIQKSNIYLQKPTTDKDNQIVIAASKRDSTNSNTGIVIQSCQIRAAPNLKPELDSYQIYLGRPLKRYARTIYIDNNFDVPLHPDGLLDPKNLLQSYKNNVDYKEYNNKIISSSTKERVRWQGVQGIHTISDQNDVEQFTVANFIQGNSWLPETGFPYNSGF